MAHAFGIILSSGLFLLLPTLLQAQSEACAGLTRLNLKEAEGGPAVILSARLVDVPGGLRRTSSYPSGFNDGTSGAPAEFVSIASWPDTPHRKTNSN
jgi:hypothetical protein